MKSNKLLYCNTIQSITQNMPSETYSYRNPMKSLSHAAQSQERGMEHHVLTRVPELEWSQHAVPSETVFKVIKMY